MNIVERILFDNSGRLNKFMPQSIINFYNKIKDEPNVLSPSEVKTLSNKESIFLAFFPTVWNDKHFLDVKDIAFGLKSGIIVKTNGDILFLTGTGFDNHWTKYSPWREDNLKFIGNQIIGRSTDGIKNSTSSDITILKNLYIEFDSAKIEFASIVQKELEEQKKAVIDNNNLKIIENEKFIEYRNSILNDFEKNKKGEINLIDNDFLKILESNSEKITEVDKDYVHKFIKISNYLETKASNIKKIFKSLNSASNETELDEYIGLIKNQIHSYDLLSFHAINMIGVVISDDLITFYQIYEKFDKLGMFNTSWENKVAKKLVNIGDQLNSIMYSIYSMEQNIVKELSSLNYTTKESFKNLNNSISNQLEKIDSAINVNNLLNGIQTYQLYKINMQTKSLGS